MESPDNANRSFSGLMVEDGKTVLISAPAKINLFLKVVGKRSDGYHDIYSWFQAVDLADDLRIQASPNTKITVTTDHPELPVGPENLIYRAAKMMQDLYYPNFGFSIHLSKRIPIGAGLGGGSSDAAATIKGINLLLNLRLTNQTMAVIGLEIGSDVPFFFSQGQAEVTGRGEIVKEISLPVDYQVLLVTPPFEIRAAEAYRMCRLDLTDELRIITFTSCRQARELFDKISRLRNDLEMALLGAYPILDKVRDELIKTRADVVRLSGSGPTMFGLYEDKVQRIEKLKAHLGEGGWGVRLTRPVILPA
jgi:4-diphosphocytidyl-2-C-methyl-D-erythritol kinase